MIVVDAVCRTESLPIGGFDERQKAFDEMATSALREYRDLARMWPTKSPVRDLLERQGHELLLMLQYHSAQLFHAVADARRRHD